jgi:hypothetical protein
MRETWRHLDPTHLPPEALDRLQRLAEEILGAVEEERRSR